MFSRKATGRMTGAVLELGTSAFAVATGFGRGDLRAEFAAGAAGALPPEAEEGFAAAAVLVFGAGDLAAEPPLGVEAGEAGLTGAAGLEADEAVFTAGAVEAAGLLPCRFAVSVFGASGFAT
jgi:hypothetical protein